MQPGELKERVESRLANAQSAWSQGQAVHHMADGYYEAHLRGEVRWTQRKNGQRGDGNQKYIGCDREAQRPCQRPGAAAIRADGSQDSPLPCRNAKGPCAKRITVDWL